MTNVDINGYSYERESYVEEEAGHSGRSDLIKVIMVFTLIGSFLCVILYGKQQTLAAYSEVSYKAAVGVATARAYDSKTFTANGKEYVTFKTTISGEREFTLEAQRYDKVFGKHRKCKCRVLTVDLSCDLGTLRTTRSIHKQLESEQALNVLNEPNLKYDSLQVGDVYTVTANEATSVVGLFFNIPIKSTLVAQEFRFGDDKCSFRDSDDEFINSNKIIMRMKNENVRAQLMKFSSSSMQFK